METKIFEIRDSMTFIPVICVRPTPSGPAQEYLLRRDGYSCRTDETCIIYIDAQCRGVAYDPYDWKSRTHKVAHSYITENWPALKDGDVIDVQFILGETKASKVSERLSDGVS